MNKQDDCMSFEVLRKEVQTFDGKDFVSGADEKRLLINPEFVESMDTSDGSEQFTPEDQKIEDEFAKSDNQQKINRKINDRNFKFLAMSYNVVANNCLI